MRSQRLSAQNTAGRSDQLTLVHEHWVRQRGGAERITGRLWRGVCWNHGRRRVQTHLDGRRLCGHATDGLLIFTSTAADRHVVWHSRLLVHHRRQTMTVLVTCLYTTKQTQAPMNAGRISSMQPQRNIGLCLLPLMTSIGNCPRTQRFWRRNYKSLLM